jgi:hypothetical protein
MASSSAPRARSRPRSIARRVRADRCRMRLSRGLRRCGLWLEKGRGRITLRVSRHSERKKCFNCVVYAGFTEECRVLLYWYRSLHFSSSKHRQPPTPELRFDDFPSTHSHFLIDRRFPTTHNLDVGQGSQVRFRSERLCQILGLGL